jgi:aspartyl-tRNA(Asn)/glutamyl-tRNA(Gln) amidotransferase subunit A
MPLPQTLGGEVKGLRVGFFQEGPFAPVDREIQAAVAQAAAILQDMGCVVKEVEFAWKDRLAIDVCMAMVVAEGEHYLRSFVQGREEELTESIQGLLGLPLPPLEDFLVSMDKRELLAQDMAQFFETYDLLLCPTGPNTAHGHEAEKLIIDGQEAALGPGHAANITATFGLTGSPALSVPFGTSQEGLPIGVQVVVQHFDEATLLRAATALEAAGVQGHPEI